MTSSLTPVASPATATYSRRTVADALAAVGVRRGDLVYFQVCTETVGRPDGAADVGALSELLHGALTDALGPAGTILAPAYTFSFCRNELFDVDATPTVSGIWNSLGAYPDYLRQRPGAIRSADPIFSTAGLGPLAGDLLTRLPHECFGADSVHDRVRRAGGKICLLGTGLYEAILRHFVEAESAVPWRYDKLFTGRIREHGVVRKEGWIYNVRMLATNADPNGAPLEELARAQGIRRAAPVGAGELVAVESGPYADLTRMTLRRDPWFSARGPAGDPLALERARVPSRVVPVALPERPSMWQTMHALWELPRDIVSDGYDVALAALAARHPMRTHEYPTGMRCWTWLVPEKWSCQEAYLETLDGRRLFSYADHPLHVVSYSLPFEGDVSRELLLEHLHVHPTLPDAIPFIFKYYDRDWALCCSRTLRDSLTDERYRVVIRSHASFGTLKVGEVVVDGETDETVVLCAHLCHPGMANDDLSGVLVGLDVMRALREGPRRRYTYRLLIVPETIGSVAWLSRHEALIPRMKGGLFLEMLATPHPPALQHSFTPSSEVDRCFDAARREHAPDGWSSPYRTIIGNDEKQFNAPGVRVPMLSLARVVAPTEPDYPYRQYHSSEDTPAVLSEESLLASRDLVLRMIDTLEANRTPVNRFTGEVFCARYGIHVDWYADRAGHRSLFDIMDRIDGTHSLIDIAEECAIPFGTVERIVSDLAERGLVEYREARPGRTSKEQRREP